MGISLTVFRLYELTGGKARYLLVKADRPEFPNWSQSAEEAAIEHVDARFASLVTSHQEQLQFSSATLIGTWEDAYPTGDVFYSTESRVALTTWIALETKFDRYFVFGIADTEEEFWASIEELHADGDLWGFEEFTRPAQSARIWFVQ